MPVQFANRSITDVKADALIHFIDPADIKSKSFLTSEVFSLAGGKLGKSMTRWENLLDISAVISDSFDLNNYRYVIHTLGYDTSVCQARSMDRLKENIFRAFQIVEKYNLQSVAVQLPQFVSFHEPRRSMLNRQTFLQTVSAIKAYLQEKPENSKELNITLLQRRQSYNPAFSLHHYPLQDYIAYNLIEETSEIFSFECASAENSYSPDRSITLDSILEANGDKSDLTELLDYVSRFCPSFSLSDIRSSKALQSSLDTKIAVSTANIIKKLIGFSEDVPWSVSDAVYHCKISRKALLERIGNALIKLNAPRACGHKFRECSPTIDCPEPAFACSAYVSESYAQPLYKKQDKSFIEMVDWWIETKEIPMKDFYIRSNLNRAMISNLRCHTEALPKKGNALACAIGLELDYEEAQDLLNRAGFSFSKYVKSDVIVEYYIKNRIYDIFEINEELFAHDLVPLGTG